MITQEEIKKLLYYNEETGIFTWKLYRGGKAKICAIANSKDSKGYIRIQINKERNSAHRLAWLYMYGKFPEFYIDHINGNKIDNRICNLREATTNQNQYNRKAPINNTSGIKGVYFDKSRSKWVAELKANNKKIFIGRFNSIELAEIAINNARKQYHREFANHGI